MKIIRHTLRSPLATAWTEQSVCLTIDGLTVGAPHTLLVNGQPAPFQFTNRGNEILIRIGFAPDEEKTLDFIGSDVCETDLSRVTLPLDPAPCIGVPGCALRIADPFSSIGVFPVESKVHCDLPLQSRILTRVNSGPLFSEYELEYRYSPQHRYRLVFRCYRHEPIIEVTEEFSLGANARLELMLNPENFFDSILARDSFEVENQPTIEPLNRDRPRDLLCRLQMPVLTEYFIPTNHGWFAFLETQHADRGMLGILGLSGSRWTNPVANMMKIYVRQGKTVLYASLESGRRHWLLYVGPVQKEFRVQGSGFRAEGDAERPEVSAQNLKPDTRHLTPRPSDGRFIFHRLHAEFNALRLDEHLDLTGHDVFDTNCWEQPGFFGHDYRERAIRNAAALRPLHQVVAQRAHLTLQTLIEPSDPTHQALLDRMLARFAKWVRQFQGFRDGQHDYAKNVIGFSRTLRGLLMDYELLRKDRFLSEEQIRLLNAYFIFAARRILDEGRWPHCRAHLHPDHPESTRDFYTYSGEHKPDRLYWSNSLPNFQSDPLCALLQLGALLPEHPDAVAWRAKALDDLENQLNNFCSRSGAWEESINYALYTLGYFVTTFRVLKRRCGIDYFNDERVRAFASWLVRYFGPFDKRFGAHTFPAIGNSRLPQQYCEPLLAFASELAADDLLRHDLMAIYQRMEAALEPAEHMPMLLAVADVPDREYPLRPLASEHMEELGVALRHQHPAPTESYLFQKIGLWKDHYENDETSFNWYAKGTPLVMDYGTYTGDVAAAAAHNLVEIPDMDPLRRGYLAEKYFTPVVDYTRSEVPVTLKLSHGHLRTWPEVDGPPVTPEYFYIGEDNPVGPKVWKTRLLLFVKPDYVVIFDRVWGDVPHRFNLHVTADSVTRDGQLIRAAGRFDLDLLCYVQHPAEFEFSRGELVPAAAILGDGAANPHRQHFFRLYNHSDGVYRTVLFAQEPGRNVRIDSLGSSGVRITTPDYEDIVFLSDERVTESTAGASFAGRAGWLRRARAGEIRACVPSGDRIEGFGRRIDGRGPWSYNLEGQQGLSYEGVPRQISTMNAPP